MLPLMTIRSIERIEPIIYHTMHLRSYPTKIGFVKSLEESPKPKSFYASSVKQLHIFSPPYVTHDEISRIASLCTGIVVLILPPNPPLRGFPPLIDTFSVLRPKRLCVCLRDMFTDPCSTNLAHPFFSQITHLDVMDNSKDVWRQCSGTLPCLSFLTHIRLVLHRHQASDQDAILQSVDFILQNCLSLQICAIWVDAEVCTGSDISGRTTLQAIADHRLVLVHNEYILPSSYTAPLWDLAHWRIAEMISEEQRVTQKRVLPPEYVADDDDECTYDGSCLFD